MLLRSMDHETSAARLRFHEVQDMQVTQMRDGHGNKLSPEQEAEIRHAGAAKSDAIGQYAPSQARPQPGGLVSANQVVLSGNGDATPGNGDGRDRESRREQ